MFSYFKTLNNGIGCIFNAPVINIFGCQLSNPAIWLEVVWISFFKKWSQINLISTMVVMPRESNACSVFALEACVCTTCVCVGSCLCGRLHVKDADMKKCYCYMMSLPKCYTLLTLNYGVITFALLHSITIRTSTFVSE